MSTPPIKPPAECLGGRCAWWVYERCALVDIALNTADIQGVADMIDIIGGAQ